MIKNKVKPNLKQVICNVLLIINQNILIIQILFFLIGCSLWFFQNSFYSNSHIHDTSLMPQPWFKFLPERLSTDSNFSYSCIESFDENNFIIRSLGTSDLSIIIEISNENSKYIRNLFRWPLAHDIYISYSNYNPQIIHSFLPPVLAYLQFDTNNSLNEIHIQKNSIVPMDLLKTIITIFSYNSPYKLSFSSLPSEDNEKMNFPYLSIKLPQILLSKIDSLVSSLDRMENQFVHGPMLYTVKSTAKSKVNLNEKLLGIPYIMSFAFISVIPHLLSLAIVPIAVKSLILASSCSLIVLFSIR